MQYQYSSDLDSMMNNEYEEMSPYRFVQSPKNQDSSSDEYRSREIANADRVVNYARGNYGAYEEPSLYDENTET